MTNERRSAGGSSVRSSVAFSVRSAAGSGGYIVSMAVSPAHSFFDASDGGGIVKFEAAFENGRGCDAEPFDRPIDADGIAVEFFRDSRRREIIRLIDNAACWCFHHNAAFQTTNRKSIDILEISIATIR